MKKTLHTIVQSPAMRLLLFLALALPLSAREFEITSIAAKVNGHAITKKEVDTQLAPMRELLKTRFPRQGAIYQRRLKEARDQILEQLINNEIVLSEIEGRASIPDYAIDEEIRRIVRENYNGKEAEFRNFLKETNQTMRSFRESQKEKILVQAYRSQQFGDIPPPTEAEIRAHYNQRKNDMRNRREDKVDFQKIFLIANDRLDPNINPESQLALAERLVLELKGGADFADLAKKYSADAYASEGGLQKDVPRLDLNLAFGEVIFENSEVGEIVGPLKDPAGFTIVKVLKKDLGPAPPLSDKEVKERMKKEVQIEKRTERYDKWINGLKKNAMIERRI
ncbi:MAG: SurA N-terminal domain-containing protein [Verrucomicrobiota bacterium JB023]|nr:SurA N-terminal domain-containing protein [Verrucomicrobiota bacterium JB023]